ncbi:MAG: glycosyltransferase family 2 protein [Anderseniella sp.]
MSQQPVLDVTIAVCTRDRSAQLERLLESFCHLEIPPATSWEVLVVDNGSVDDTPQLLERFTERLPLRCINEPTYGISSARNRAFAATEAEFIVCTDDDCIVPTDWLVNFLTAASRYQLADLFAGEVYPHFDGADEAWGAAARQEAPSAFARFKFGLQDTRIDWQSDLPLIPFGANYAVRTKTARQFSFDRVVGRGSHETLLLGGEETRYFLRILNAGHVGWLVAGPPVKHRISSDKATLQYLTRYYFGVGLQWGQMPGSPAWINALRRKALGILCHLAPHLLGRRHPLVAIARVRDWNMARGALNSHTLDKEARMVDEFGKTIF